MIRGKFSIVSAAVLGLWMVAGCDTVAVPLEEPDAATRIVGGIADQRPYFGRLQRAGGDAGEFLLATCGCGDWRVLLTDGATGQQWQMSVHFYAPGADAFATDVSVFGEDGDNAILGMLQGGPGQADGSTNHGMTRMGFTAARGDAHTDNAEACVKCHIGENPVWPQPEGHPAYQLNPANCLSCHDVVIDN